MTATAAPAVPVAPTVPSSPLPSSRLTAAVALLRERKLDRTLSTSLPGAAPEADLGMPLEVPALDARLAGGLPRGQLSEVVGPASSGRTSLIQAWLGAASRRGEYVALVDTFDRFDPASGVACGIELSRMLWVRGQAISKTASAVDPAWLPGVRTVQGPGTLLERTIDRALKALNLILQSGVCTAVVIDLADVSVSTLARIPASTWLRVQRIVEGTETACVILGPVPIARSAGGITITTGSTGSTGSGVRRAEASPLDSARGALSESRKAASAETVTGSTGSVESRVRWAGVHDRARRVSGLEVSARLMSPRRRVAGTVTIAAHADASI
jgi:recombination protein RecA